MSVNSAPLEQAAQLLRAARRVVVFTGAGVSAESGIPTFRDDDGFWQRFPPEQFARWNRLLVTGMVRPGLLAEFLQAVLEPIATAKPNAAHRAIARLETRVPTTVITQNVDGLHQDAGSSHVCEVHGSFFRVASLRGRTLRQLKRDDLAAITERVARSRNGMFKLLRLLWSVRPMFGPSWHGCRRPGIVLFGGALAEPDWSQAQRDVDFCDMVLVVGTSGLVYPAAILPGRARRHGANVVSIDPTEPGPSHVWLQGRAGDVLPRLVEAAFP
jgi:NAD-dependent deacetylase